jgi:hypothetical protein
VTHEPVHHERRANFATSLRRYSTTVDFVATTDDKVMATPVLSVGPLHSDESANWSTPAAGQSQANLLCVILRFLCS